MTKDMFKEVQRLTQFAETVKIGDKAVLRWSAGSAGHYTGLATIVKINAKSVVGTLDHPVDSQVSDTPYPVGRRIRVPRALFGAKWEWYNVAMPVDLARELGWWSERVDTDTDTDTDSDSDTDTDTDTTMVRSDDPVEYRATPKPQEPYRSKRPQVCCSLDAFGEARRILYRELTEENFAIMHLNNKNEILEIVVVAIGSATSCRVSPAPVFRKAILLNSTRIILMHNHPSGDPTPSQSDVTLTKRLCHAGDLLGISVLDHMVLGEESYFSMLDTGLMSSFEKYKYEE